MTTPIEFACPHCSRALKVKAHGAGRTIPCPGCKSPVVVPSPQMAAVGDDDIDDIKSMASDWASPQRVADDRLRGFGSLGVALGQAATPPQPIATMPAPQPPAAHQVVYYAHPSQAQPMTQERDPFSPGLAAVMSFFIPGLGQMCQGKYASGIVWLVAVPIGYVALIVPGVVLHLICVVHAARG